MTVCYPGAWGEMQFIRYTKLIHTQHFMVKISHVAQKSLQIGFSHTIDCEYYNELENI